MAQIFLRSIDTPSVKKLIQEVRRFPRITNEQARQMAKLALTGNDKARNDLFNSSLWYAINVALCYKNLVPSAELEDLISEASIGLLRALDGYNPDLQLGFLNYALYSMKNQIRTSLEKDTHMERLPHRAYVLKRKIERAENEFLQEFGFEPSVEDLIDITGATKEQIYEVTHTDVDSFDADEDNYGADSIMSDTYENSIDIYNKEKVNYLLSKLSPREQYIINRTFGLNDAPESEQKDIANDLGLTCERVRQIKVKALKTMQQLTAA